MLTLSSQRYTASNGRGAETTSHGRPDRRRRGAQGSTTLCARAGRLSLQLRRQSLLATTSRRAIHVPEHGLNCTFAGCSPASIIAVRLLSLLGSLAPAATAPSRRQRGPRPCTAGASAYTRQSSHPARQRPWRGAPADASSALRDVGMCMPRRRTGQQKVSGRHGSTRLACQYIALVAPCSSFRVLCVLESRRVGSTNNALPDLYTAGQRWSPRRRGLAPTRVRTRTRTALRAESLSPGVKHAHNAMFSGHRLSRRCPPVAAANGTGGVRIECKQHGNSSVSRRG